MNNQCPTCSAPLFQESKSWGAHLEHCSTCGMAWLDFSSNRPRIYGQLEAQVCRWERRYRQELTRMTPQES